MTAPLDLVALIYEASTTDSMRVQAIALWADVSARIFDRNSERTGVRMSDVGKCVREVWADINGKLDLPIDPDTQLMNFDSGSFWGAWLACLAAVAIQKYAPNFIVRVEPEVDYLGIPGHVDLLIFDDHDHAYWVIEFKSTYWTKGITDPAQRSRYQCLQAAGYALATAAPLFSIVTIAPATQQWDAKARARARIPKLAQFDYDPREFEAEVREELDRLKQATQSVSDAPEGDATEDFRCRSCRYSNCVRHPVQIAAYEQHVRDMENAS